jgi:hypothetical protein
MMWRKCSFMTALVGFCFLFQVVHAQEEKFIAEAKKFLATPEGAGAQNALANYVAAMEQFDIAVYLAHERGFKKILAQGFSGSETAEIGVLQSLQPVLNEVWRGNEKPFVKYPPIESLSAPVPNFLKIQLLGKLLVIQALYCEFIKKPDYAIAWFKHGLIFSQRTCDENSMLIAKLISILMEKNALQTLEQFMTRQNLTKEAYLSIADYLATLRQGEIPLWQIMKIETKRTRQIFAAMQAPGQGTTGESRLSAEEKQQIESLVANKEAFLKEYDEYAQRLEELLKKDCAEIARLDFSSLTANLPLLSASPQPNFKEAGIRNCITLAHWSLALAEAQLLTYRAAKGSLPQQISAVAELGFTPPNDPFSGKPFQYGVTGAHGVLYSLGPNLQDEQARVSYDPTNGTVSAGDIIVAV